MVDFIGANQGLNQSLLLELSLIDFDTATVTVTPLSAPTIVKIVAGDLEVRIEGSFSGSLMDLQGTADTAVFKRSNETVLTLDNLGITDVGAFLADLQTDVVATLLELFGGDDTFMGSTEGDELYGFAGNDFIDGKDTLTGGLDNDCFVFSAKAKKKNVDHITDFVRDEDMVKFDLGRFKKLKKEGDLKKKFFAKKKADDDNDYVTYNKKNGKVKYDKDGDGDAKAKLVAIIDDKLNLNHKDFGVLDL